MKILLGLLILVSCSKTKYQEIPYSPKKETSSIRAQKDWSDYSPLIDVMVAFLWPEKLARPEDQVKLENVIRISRELKTRKERFQEIKMTLKEEFESNQCSCVLNGECTGEEEDLNEEKCYEIEEKIYANDRTLVDIFGLVEEIKANVKSVGGEWLDTHLDLREIPTSSIDFEKMKINFSALGSYENRDGKFPISYEIKSTPIYKEDFFDRLEFNLPRYAYFNHDLIPYGEWSINVGISQSQATLLFQGELQWHYQGKTRQGIIYWENPRL